MTQEPSACRYKILPCVCMVHASPHGRYRTSAACCYRRLWWQMLLPSEEKTRRSHEYSIADVSRPLGHCQEPWPDCLGMPARLHGHTCLESCEYMGDKSVSENSFGLGQIPLSHLQSLMVQLFILLL